MLSLGCPKNLVDSEVMLGLAQEAGHEITADATAADVLVVNTCAFIDAAKQESIDAILEMAAQKQSGRCRRLIVTGCLAERYRADLQRDIPEIDVVLGTGEVPQIVSALDGVDAGRDAVRTRPGPLPVRAERPPSPVAVSPVSVYRRHEPSVPARIAARHRTAVARGDVPTYLYDAATPRILTTPPHYAYIKIAEGCDYNCAFCIIPALRGPYRSRPAASVVAEAHRLAARGVKEILLISQDTTFYGVDRRERGALARLLRDLDAVAGLSRIRLLYLYPTTLTDDVLDAMADLPKVCKYVDLPLQHSATSVLERMRRPGHRAAYEKLIARIRRRVPDVAVRTTVIVGFPGETREEFRDLCEFARSVEFDHLGVFTYSHEEGTAAYQRDDNVPPRVKIRRQERLQELQREIVTRRHRDRIGRRATLMVDGPSREHPLVVEGRLDGQAPEIDPVVYLTECDPVLAEPGACLEVEIVDARGSDLVARPLAVPFSGVIS
jgi:ribosomal protein S12 methylthiotransferase